MMTANPTKTPARRRANPWIARVAGVALSAGALLAAPQAARAQEEDDGIDARVRGYAQEVALEPDNTALTWLLFAFITLCGLSVLFKSAKRTHLD